MASSERSGAPLGPNDLMAEAIERHKAGDLANASRLYRRLLQDAPGHGAAWANLGIALKFLGDLPGALEACAKAASLEPGNANAHNNMGIVLSALGRHEQAVAAHRRALAIEPAFHECWTNLGLSLSATGNPGPAVEAFRRALAIKPDHTEALVQFIYHSLQICDWRQLDAAIARMAETIAGDKGEVNPFVQLAICQDPAESLRAARNFARRVEKSVAVLERPSRPRVRKPGRPRIGYIGGDFHGHATAFLAAEMFECHDRDRFEIFTYSYGPDDGSDMRKRVAGAFEHFVELSQLSLEASAKRIAEDEIDLLIDLKGYTQGARTGILALRPAPLQAAYLGYPGTMGADFVDFAIVDGFIAPKGFEAHYTERLIRLPGSYQPNDSRRRIATDAGTRADHGLPETAVVFCCFNQTYKIGPHTFSIWMRLLEAVPDSVLWLMAFNADAPVRLRETAKAAGISPDRLVFADKRPLDQHLARIQLADLFLDTWPCNAHTTASDALWAGIPVVTFAGRTFASRVAGSLLAALGMTELIAGDVATYEKLALRLALDAPARARMKSRLLRARETGDLFSGEKAARKLESAFDEMLSSRA
jgi:predicted O-linked N-acetylglucosamine transferase (SPINDLY family)